MDDQQFYNYVEQIVLETLSKNKINNNQWHLGTVDSVISSTSLKVFVDGSTQSQTVSCNPDITFATGNRVWVIYINGNPRDKFVLSKRAIV